MSTLATAHHAVRSLPGLGRLSVRGLASSLALLAVAAAWFAYVRPTTLGGATGYVMVSGESMEPGLSSGDLVLTRRAAEYRRGDVIAFRIPEGDVGAGATVIHRIVGGSAEAGYVTRGDNRDADDRWRARPQDVVGRLVVQVPSAGGWVAIVRSPPVLAGLAAALTLLAWPAGRRGGSGRDDGSGGAVAPP